VNSILWRRLDTPGHDACRLEKTRAGWSLEGSAVFREDGVPAWLTYRVTCDLAWRTQQGQVRGWIGPRAVDIGVTRTSDGRWTLNGQEVSGLGSCVDLDLGFTPATNLLLLRRVNLPTGKAAEVPVAWLNPPATKLEILSQRYERRSDTEYWYEAPTFRYAALLEVSPIGFIQRYPGLWEAEP
jgi:uncharacterized protein